MFLIWPESIIFWTVTQSHNSKLALMLSPYNEYELEAL